MKAISIIAKILGGTVNLLFGEGLVTSSEHILRTMPIAYSFLATSRR
jgi:hypothetical protein